MIELTNGSLGEGQPTFKVMVSDVVTPDQVEQIAMFMKQGADEMRARLQSDEEAYCSVCQNPVGLCAVDCAAQHQASSDE